MQTTQRWFCVFAGFWSSQIWLGEWIYSIDKICNNCNILCQLQSAEYRWSLLLYGIFTLIIFILRKSQGKDIFKRKSRVGIFTKQREKCHETGPRQVEHQRALFIYLYFCKTFENLFSTEDIDLAIDFTSQVKFIFIKNYFPIQIRILEEAGLLKVVSAHDNFDLPMYVSMCTLDFVKQIARFQTNKLI